MNTELLGVALERLVNVGLEARRARARGGGDVVVAGPSGEFVYGVEVRNAVTRQSAAALQRPEDRPLLVVAPYVRESAA